MPNVLFNSVGWRQSDKEISEHSNYATLKLCNLIHGA